MSGKDLGVILSRRSVRKFKDKKVPKEDLDKILDAGRWAPSGINNQPWVFVVIDEPERKKALRQSYDFIRKEIGLYKQDSSFLENAALVLACMEVDKPVAVISVSLAVENMLLAANALGLGSLVMTTHVVSDDGRRGLSRLFNLPNNVEPHSLLAFGYADEKPEPSERKAEEETFHLNEYGKAYKLGKYFYQE